MLAIMKVQKFGVIEKIYRPELSLDDFGGIAEKEASRLPQPGVKMPFVRVGPGLVFDRRLHEGRWD